MSKEELQKEQQRVDQVIDQVEIEMNQIKQDLSVTEENNRVQLLENGQIKLRTGSNSAAWEATGILHQQEQQLMIDSHLLSAQNRRMQVLDKMSDSPYFGRIDFVDTYEGQDELVSVYLGIGSLKASDGEYVVYDWRAPISNLYYEGKIGTSTYETAAGIQEVEVTLKRQFIVENKLIKTMADTSETIGDDVLLEVLGDSSNVQMKSIVATIQQQQNEIIRNTTSKVMLVQGVAGSGKTSALLQRIAFLLYHHREYLSAKDMLLFSPNRLFSEYISMVLPSLGEEDINRISFVDFMQEHQPKFRLDKNTVLSKAQSERTDKGIQTYKSSFSFYKWMDQYLEGLQTKGLQFLDLNLGDDTIFPKQTFRQLFKGTDSTWPLSHRIAEVKRQALLKIEQLKESQIKADWVEKEVELMSEEVLAEIERKYSNRNFQESDEIQRELAMRILNRKYKAVSKRINRLGFISYKRQYLHLLMKVSETNDLAALKITPDAWQKQIEYVKSKLIRNQLSGEDAPIFYLLQKRLTGSSAKKSYKYIFIDEIQDYTPYQIALLKELYPNANYTFSGDLNQTIYGNQPVISSFDQIFVDQTIVNIQLTTSYRSTKEITEFTNHLLGADNGATAYGRVGQLPRVAEFTADEPMYKWLVSELKETASNQKQRKVIIGKDLKSCQEIYRILKDQLEVQLVDSEQSSVAHPLIIVPSYLAKGLEFDTVYALNADTESYKSADDRNILYTVCSRAMHELTVVNTKTLTKFVSDVPVEYYQTMKN